MAVAGIFHTGITVSDLDRSIAFYRDCLGLELVTRWESSQPYLRTVVGFPDAELRIALLRCRRWRPASPATTSSSWSTAHPAANGAMRGPVTPATPTWPSSSRTLSLIHI